MISLLSLAACSLMLLQALVAGAPAHVPRYFQPSPLTRRTLTASTVQSELGPLLSTGTLIFGPSSPAFANATSRWVTYVQPNVQVVVEVAAESDISKIVSRIIQLCDPRRKFSFAKRGRRSSIATITASSSSRGIVGMQSLHL